jgi:hypothetical protein
MQVAIAVTSSSRRQADAQTSQAMAQALHACMQDAYSGELMLDSPIMGDLRLTGARARTFRFFPGKPGARHFL